MSNGTTYSDSQESVFLDEAEYEKLQKELARDLLTSAENPDTKDILMQYSEPQYYMAPDTAIPIRDEFPGNYNFELFLPDQPNSKHWVYSRILSKVFINMEQTLPLRFKWEPAIDGLFLRTTMVFSLDQYMNDPVQRCHNHMAAPMKGDREVAPNVVKHVVRCLNPQSSYEERNNFLSVLAPLGVPQAGSSYVPMYFQFFCKNSCMSGMNRRPTELIFTLEDAHGVVLGRRKLLVRVCSCPKRDKQKEEMEAMDIAPGGKKRKHSVPAGKKLMITNPDTQLYNVQFNVVGRDNYLSILKYGMDLMSSQAYRSGQSDLFKPHIDHLLHKMSQ